MGGRVALATSRYHAADLIAESGLLPLGITVGAARQLRYDLAGNVGMLAPHGLRHLEGDEFDVAYRARLERFGVDAIAGVLSAFIAAHQAPGAVSPQAELHAGHVRAPASRGRARTDLLRHARHPR